MEPILKWLVYIAAILFGIYVLLRYLANFTGWAKGLLDALRSFWEGWFGRRSEQEVAESDEEEPSPVVVPYAPFANFRNPFLGGGAHRPPDELVRYSFEALQAWAYERNLGRKPEETPLEFADRLGESVPMLAADVQQLTHLYAQSCYGRGKLTNACQGPLKKFWERLTAAAQERVPLHG